MFRVLLAIVVVLALAPAVQAEAGLHASWDRVLKAHVDGEGRVDYAAIKAAPAELAGYLATLAATDPSKLSRDGKLAFWINAYNAFTVKLILNHYPLASIRDIKEPWKQKIWDAGGKRYSLDEIEHRILREKFKEPRIHFALVCASIGCPKLARRAFTEAGVQAALDAATRGFVQSKAYVRTGARGLFKARKTLYLSKIFKWFEEDFTGGGKRPVAEFVALYATPETKRVIASAGKKLQIAYLPYDWNLNGKP